MKEFILPLKELVVHPGLTVPIFLDNQTSALCLATAARGHSRIILAPQKTGGYPTAPEDIHNMGTIGDIVQVLHMPDGAIHSVIKTSNAVQLEDIQVDKDGIFTASAKKMTLLDDSEFEQTIALRDRVLDVMQAVATARRLRMDKLREVVKNYPMAAFVDTVVQMADFETSDALQILAAESWREKLIMILEKIEMMSEIAKIDASINKRVREQMENGHKQQVLAEKMRAIQKELGEDSEEMDAESLKKRVSESKMPVEAKEKALSEWRRMKNQSPMSTEGALLKTYLDELLSMPWYKSDVSEIDLNKARAALDAHHSGMKPVKERILEHIAVMRKTGGNGGTILCLVGSPGVGKTSLGKSIAQALGRKYHRISLGGVSDEALFRGHRKTYIGSQPGRLMDALKRCGANNPVIVLDEIDKIGRDHRGDPESALLEILDPEQNKTFRDHYLEVDFDLSNVIFVATSNTLNMSNALKDRMEIIEIASYSEDEKLGIARNHLLARAAKDTGWAEKNIKISDDGLRHIIRSYTAEDGVRELQRQMTAMLRRALLQNDGEDQKTEFTKEKIDELLKQHKSASLGKKIGFTSARV